MTSLSELFQSKIPPRPIQAQRTGPAAQAPDDGFPPIPAGYVTGMVEAEDMTPEKARLGTTGYTHVSSLMGICQRQHVIAAMHNVKIMRPVTGAQRVVWRLGRAAEAHVRESFIKARNYRGIFGKWECQCGDAFRIGLHDHETLCAKCGSGLNRYAEPTLYDHEYRITGNPDMSIYYQGYMVPFECKSIEGDGFNALEGPKGDHVHQALMYRWLYERNGFKVHKKVIIYYVSKKFGFARKKGSQETWRPYKEYHVDASTPAMQAIVEQSLVDAAAIRDGHLNQRAPARTLCSTHDCATAKECPVAGLCWNLP